MFRSSRLLQPQLYRSACSRRFLSHCPRPRLIAPIRHDPPVYASLHTSNSLAASFPFKLFDIGEGITEVEIISWQVKTGQRVEEFDPLCEVQSDKSTVELTSPKAGWVGDIRFDVGNSVSVGQVLCEIRDQEGEEIVEAEPMEEGPESTRPVKDVKQDQTPLANSQDPTIPVEDETRATSLTKEEILSSQINEQLGTIDKSVSTDDDISLLSSRDAAFDMAGGAQFTGEASILPSPPDVPIPPQAPSSTLRRRAVTSDTSEERSTIKASPAVRTLAARLGVDLTGIDGSGDEGRITREDVERLGGSSDALTTARGRERSSVPESSRVNFGRTRKAMWKGLTSQGSRPHFGYSHTLNLTPLLPYLQNASMFNTLSKPAYLASDIPADLVLDPLGSSSSPKPTLLSFLIKGLLLALEAHPIMRAKVVGSDNDRYLDIRRDGIIGVAVSDPKNGLLTPSLPPLPPSTSISEITSHLSALRLNPNKPNPAPSITISSVGNLGESMGAMPILPPGGGLAICAVGRAKWEVEWGMRDVGLKGSVESVGMGGMKPVLRCPVGWSGDHRVLEGAELIAFTESWKRYIEEPWRWLGKDS